MAHTQTMICKPSRYDDHVHYIVNGKGNRVCGESFPTYGTAIISLIDLRNAGHVCDATNTINRKDKRIVSELGTLRRKFKTHYPMLTDEENTFYVVRG